MFDSNKLAVFKVDRCVLYLSFYLNLAKSKLAGKFQSDTKRQLYKTAGALCILWNCQPKQPAK